MSARARAGEQAASPRTARSSGARAESAEERRELERRLAAAQRENDELRKQIRAIKQILSAIDESAALKALATSGDREAINRRLRRVEQQWARLRLKKTAPDADGQPMLTVEFWEADEDGKPLAKPREFRVRGGEVYVGSVVAEFDEKLVPAGDALRGTRLFGFDAIFGNRDDGEQCARLLRDGAPHAYGSADSLSDLEKRAWSMLAGHESSEKSLAQLGLRVVHRDGISLQMRDGFEYELRLRPNGDCTAAPKQPRREPSPAAKPPH